MVCFSPFYNRQKSVKKIIDGTRPDFVYFNSMYSPLYTLLPLWILLRQHYTGKIILVPRGMLHKGALKRKYFKEYVFLRIFRLISWHRKVIFHATNRQEQKRHPVVLFYESKNYGTGQNTQYLFP